mmetsp:Transcript_5832/g.17027  ORF Transcript_5832/g.17027 Transcript_5832/m.17027 type:complete len:331 (-) Transcript_5832:155-1147(-)
MAEEAEELGSKRRTNGLHDVSEPLITRGFWAKDARFKGILNQHLLNVALDSDEGRSREGKHSRCRGLLGPKCERRGKLIEILEVVPPVGRDKEHIPRPEVCYEAPGVSKVWKLVHVWRQDIGHGLAVTGVPDRKWVQACKVRWWVHDHPFLPFQLGKEIFLLVKMARGAGVLHADEQEIVVWNTPPVLLCDPEHPRPVPRAVVRRKLVQASEGLLHVEKRLSLPRFCSSATLALKFGETHVITANWGCVAEAQSIAARVAVAKGRAVRGLKHCHLAVPDPLLQVVQLPVYYCLLDKIGTLNHYGHPGPNMALHELGVLGGDPWKLTKGQV